MQDNTNFIQALVLILLFIFLFPTTLSNAVLPSEIFADQGGRLVTLPKIINTVYTTTEAGAFLAYALEPSSIIGWNRGLSPELEFAIEPNFHNLPTLGTWDENYQTIKVETVLELEPDLIIHYANVDEENIALASEIQQVLGIPTVLADKALGALPETLRLFGQLLGREVRGQALATFVENHLNQASSFQSRQVGYAPIPVHIVSPYEPGHFDEILHLVGMVEMETWDDQPPMPDFVLVMPHTVTDPYRAIERDGHKRIYQIPAFPSNWLDPGSIFSLLGLEWLHSIAYPTSYTADLAETYGAFMEVFFQVNVTPELLDWTLRRSGISY